MKSINPEKTENKDQTIFYDAQCRLCNGLKHSVEKRDTQNTFFFQPLHLSEYKDANHLIFLENGKLYHKSDAVIKILQKLRRFKLLSFFLILIPKFLRDFGYDIIAKYRNRILKPKGPTTN